MTDDATRDTCEKCGLACKPRGLTPPEYLPFFGKRICGSCVSAYCAEFGLYREEGSRP